MATNVTGGAGSASTTSLTAGQISPAIQAYYDRNLLERAVPADVHGRFGQSRPIKLRSGNRIKFRRYEALTVNTTPLTEGVTPSSQNVSITEVEAPLAQYGAVVSGTDMVSFTVQDPVLTEVGEQLGENGGTTVDQVRRDVLVAGTNVVYASAVAARVNVVNALSAIDLRMAIRALTRQNAKFVKDMITATTGIGTKPVRAAFMAVVHPDTEAELEQLTGYVPVSEYSSAMKAEENEVGSFRNIRFFTSTNAKVFPDAGAAIGGSGMITTTGSNCDVYATLIFAANAYGTCPLQGHAMENIVKPLGSGDDPLNQRWTSGWKATTTTSILNQAWMVRIEHTNRITLT